MRPSKKSGKQPAARGATTAATNTALDDWNWSDEYQGWYRSYTDVNGEVQYVWGDPRDPEFAAIAQSLAQRLGHMSVVGEYTEQSEYTTARAEAGYTEFSPRAAPDIEEEAPAGDDYVPQVQDEPEAQDEASGHREAQKPQGHQGFQRHQESQDYQEFQDHQDFQGDQEFQGDQDFQGDQGFEGDEESQGRQHPQAVQATSSKSKSGEKKSSSRSHDKKPSKSKKDGKGVDKKGKGKGKDLRPLDEPEEPFFEPKQPHQQQHQQHQQHQQQQEHHQQQQPQQHHSHRHRASRQTRAHGHQAAPTGTTGGATQGDSQPIDGGYGARHAASSGSAPSGTHPLEEPYEEDQGLQDQIDTRDEILDPEISTDAGYGTGYPPADDEENDDFNRAIAESKEAAYGSSGGYHEQYGQDYSPGESSYAQEEDYAPVDEEEGDGDITPTRDNPRPEADAIISGTQGSYEPIDARYRVEPSHKFQPGEVFKILWSEPQGQSRGNYSKSIDIESYTERIRLENDYGQKFYVGFRRFIVVANDEGHCTCVPILTYIRQGCKKKGAKPAKHGIVHEMGSKPRPLEGEPELGFKPIRMEIKASGERLARESRVNYSKLVTVEHNVKVFFIGNIHPHDFDTVVGNAVNQCWQEKIHRRVKERLKNVRT